MIMSNYRGVNTSKLVDAHCHLHEFTDQELVNYCRDDLLINAVSDDYLSSLRTLDIVSKCRNVLPSVGLHPWNIGKVDISKELRSLSELVSRVRFLGEVGIDKRFVPETYDKQLEVFKYFLELARDYGLGVNVHAVSTWDEVIKLLTKYDIRIAIIHWYTGPTELLKDIESLGYYITINPAVKIQLKHREVVMKAPIEIILTESDGPYVYRGMRLVPTMVLETLHEIAKIKGTSFEEVSTSILKNFMKVFKSCL